MKRATIEAMEEVCSGLMDLLEALKTEPMLCSLDYPAMTLGPALQKLRHELGQEEVSD